MTDRTDRPLVTFAVIAYNQERFVREAVEGAFAQTYEPLEIILSDDGSSDRTFEILQEMAAAYDGPHKVMLNRNEPNLGLVPHVNRIFEMSSGELICVTAGDDISIPSRVVRLFDEWYYSYPRPFLIHSRVTKIDDAGNAQGDFRPDDSLRGNKILRLFDLMESQKNGIGATFCTDRRVYEHFRELPNFCQIEDRPLFFRAAALGPVHYIDAPLVMYRLGGISAPSVENPAYRTLFGDRIKFLSWKVSSARCMMHDLDQIENFPEKQKCIRFAKRFTTLGSLEVDLSKSTGLHLALMFPRTLLVALQYLSIKPLRIYVKYLLYYFLGTFTRPGEKARGHPT
jgi:glycosyltransferase involved in cell wall biosynthesis